jgi:hypothetical protein
MREISLFALDGTIPGGTTALAVSLSVPAPASGSITADVGEITVRNLTALGVA